MHTYVLVDIRISIVNVCLASGFFYNFILLQYSVGISVELQHKKFWFLGDSGLFRGSGEHKICMLYRMNMLVHISTGDVSGCVQLAVCVELGPLDTHVEHCSSQPYPSASCLSTDSGHYWHY